LTSRRPSPLPSSFAAKISLVREPRLNLELVHPRSNRIRDTHACFIVRIAEFAAADIAPSKLADPTISFTIRVSLPLCSSLKEPCDSLQELMERTRSGSPRTQPDSCSKTVQPLYFHMLQGFLIEHSSIEFKRL
jgi:hypothetical protein